MLIFRQFILVSLLSLFCAEFTLFAQNRKYYEKLRKSKKDNIEFSRQILKELKSSNEDQLDKLTLTKELILKQKEILNLLTKEILLLDEEISINELQLEKYEIETGKLKEEYAQLLKYAFLTMDIQRKMIYILSAGNFNKAYKRIIYLQHLSDFRKSRIEKISESVLKTSHSLAALNLKRSEKSSLIAQRNSDIDSLEIIRKQLDVLIYNNNLEINKLIEISDAENIKKSLAKESISKTISDQNLNKNETVIVKSNKLDENISVQFEGLKRFHIWPLSKFVILHHFGDYAHPVLENITVKNDGVVLGSKGGNNVHAIFEGLVVNIINIPGDGNSIIIKHGEYYSVYSQMDVVLTKSGSMVKKGEVIAKLLKSDRMVKMGFQLWKGKDRLNPEAWLKKL